MRTRAIRSTPSTRRAARSRRPAVSRHADAGRRAAGANAAGLQYLIDDGFNRIVLYDNKAHLRHFAKAADGKYEVTLDVQARKVQADGNGVESPMPLADYVDIGVFTGKRTKRSRCT